MIAVYNDTEEKIADVVMQARFYESEYTNEYGEVIIDIEVGAESSHGSLIHAVP